MWAVIWHQDFCNYLETIKLTRISAKRIQRHLNTDFYDIGRCEIYKIRLWQYKKFKKVMKIGESK